MAPQDLNSDLSKYFVIESLKFDTDLDVDKKHGDTCVAHFQSDLCVNINDG